MNYICIENYKLFKTKTEFHFKPLTILTGTNSSGKSSLTKFIRALNSKGETLDFNESISQTISHNSNSDCIQYSKNLTLSGINEKIKIHSKYKSSKQEIFELVEYKILNEFNNYIIHVEHNVREFYYNEEYNFIESYPHDVHINSKYIVKKYFDLIVTISDLLSTYQEILNIIKKNFTDPYKLRSLKHSNGNDIELNNLVNKYLDIANKLNIEEENPDNIIEIFNINPFTVSENESYDHEGNGWNIKFKLFELKKKELFIIAEEILLAPTIFSIKSINKENRESLKSEIEKIRAIEFEEINVLFSRECSIDGKFVINNNSPYTFLTNLGFHKPFDYEIDKKIKEFVNIDFDEFELGMKYKYLQDVISYLFDIVLIKLHINTSYIPSIRSLQNKYYHLNKNDTYLEGLLKYVNIVDKNKLEFANKWIRKFGIGDSIEIKKYSELGVNTINIIDGEHKINLSNVGFGMSQFLPIILQCTLFENELVIIEEPETNLHPALQSKIADFIVDCIKEFKTQFILETHSEYLIRKLQYLIAKGDFSHNDANIYYFNSPKSQNYETGDIVKRIEFEKDGILTDTFGSGFFDEADNLSLKLLSLSHGQQN